MSHATAHEPAIPLPGERQQEILRLLREQGRVLAAPLALHFNVSEDSIRRDLRELAQRGLCRRVHGGALPLTPAFPPLAERQRQDPSRKQALASLAAGLLRHGDVVALDAGSTNSAIAAALPIDLQLRVVTNAPDIALALMGRHDIEVTLVGGRLEPRSGAVLGLQAMEYLDTVHVDVCFAGTCAIDSQGDAWAIDGEEAAFKRALLRRADRFVAVATNEKLGAVAAHRIARHVQVDTLLVEADAPAALVHALRQRGLDVLLAPPVAA
ncbi:DeoR family transcriptional regulator [Stenotrophomonas tumulicola]|uniref:DeoR/GlpR transcriptional regulator n=1 Tax=Stenotrophomonas tumulicola TaxID=1685415 RepID=A0A7W3FK10_9GAMM|nr:DeoR/GlpR transcriptional regulator [Stenotrophomonas tumulicola]